MPLQGGPKPKCKGCSKCVFKTGDLCVAVIEKYTPKHKDKDGNHLQVDATYRYCHKLCCIAKSSLPAPKRILLDTDLQLTPEELDSLQNLPIVSTRIDKSIQGVLKKNCTNLKFLLNSQNSY
jgi:hypothetical protein